MGNSCQQSNNQQMFDEEKTVHSQDFPSKISTNHQHNEDISKMSTKQSTRKKEQTPQTQVSKPIVECPYTFIRRPAPNFTGTAYHNGFKQISLKDYKGQYVVLFFFPFDVSEICRKEILAFQDLNDKFQKIACQVVGCSSDSQFVHQSQCSKKREDGGLGNLDIPLLSDVDRQIATSYGVIIEDGETGEKGTSFRSTFIIDNHQILRHISINDVAISVNPDEILRLVYTFQENDRANPSGRPKGCPFSSQAKENIEIDTVSKYQRKRSDDEEDIKNMASSKRIIKKTANGQDECEQTMINKLGGEEIVQEIADKFAIYVFNDQLLKPFFLNKTSMHSLKKSIGSFLKTYFGSQQEYLGKNMRDAHKDLMLNDEHFNKASEYFKTIFQEMGLKPQLVHELILYIEPLRSQITQKPSQSLFHRVDGEAGIRKAVKFYFSKILARNEIKPFFSKCDLEKTQESYVAYLSLVFGGSPNKYKGRQMRDCHYPLHISEKIFNFCIDQLRHAFKENGLDPTSLQEVCRLLECLRSQIPKKMNTLYDRLGGHANLEKACKKLYEEKIMKAEKIADFFKNVDMKALSLKMVDYYAMITGGPIKFQGKSAKESHKNFNIMSGQFDVYKELLKNSMIESGSTQESVNEFMNLIDTIKIEVIGGKPPSLFDKIGGEETLKKFNEIFFTKIMEEMKIRHYFINIDLSNCKTHFLQFIVMATGGVNKYEGQDVRQIHEQMDISDKDFKVFMDVVKDAASYMKFNDDLLNEFIHIFESMKQMIATIED